MIIDLVTEKFDDTVVVWSRKSKDRLYKDRLSKDRLYNDRLYNGHKKQDNRTKTYKTLHRKLKIEQLGPLLKPGWTQVLRKGKQFLLHMLHP
jgi:hypothetical protein